jgi:hypothetical protein
LTKNAIKTLSNFEKIPGLKGFMKKTNALAIFVPEKTPDIFRSFKNIGNVRLEDVRSINPVSLLSSKRVLFVSPEAIVRILSSKSNKSTFKGEASVEKAPAVEKVAAGRTTKKKK